MASSTLRPHRARRYLLPTLFAALVGVFALTGCGLSVSSDPLVAARVNGHAIPLSAYEDIVRLNRANAAMQATAPDWQSTVGRSQLYPMEKDALDTLIKIQVTRDALAKHNITISANDVKTERDNFNKQVDSLKDQLKAQPNNTALRNLIDSLTPDTVEILSQEVAAQKALAKASIFPSAHVRGLLVAHQDEANDILNQAKNGADFGQLAKTRSLDSESAAQSGELGRVIIGQFGSQFDDIVFGAHATNDKYFMLPNGDNFAVFEVTDRRPESLPAGLSSQDQQAVITAWMSTLPNPKVEQYITIG